MSLSSEAKQEVERLVQAGRKIDAIKYLQVSFKVSFEEALSLAEAVQTELKASQAWNVEQGASETIASQETSILSGLQKSNVIQMIADDQKLEAVKYVRAQTDLGLAEAKLIVDEIESELPALIKPHKTKPSASLSIFILVFGAIAMLLFGFAAIIFYNQYQSIATSDMVKARVIDFRYSKGAAAAIVSYEWHGETKKYYSNGYSNPPANELGEEVELFVNRNDPTDAMINSFTDRWLGITILSGMGLVFGFFATLFFFMNKR
jgi:ribosomal protein L7/L12